MRAHHAALASLSPSNNHRASRPPLWFQALLLAGLLLLLLLIYVRHLAPASLQASGETLFENSGIVARQGGGFWAIADSGGAAALYQLSNNGVILSSFPVSPASNEDWEDLATDGKRKIYAGDIGDNASERDFLTIYELTLNSKGKPQPKPSARIVFRYPKSRPSLHSNYDAESLVYLGGQLYIFTKRRADTHSQVYRVRAKSSQRPQVASLVGSLDLAKRGSWFNFGTMATAASLSPDARSLAILTYRSVLVFSDPSLAPMPLDVQVSASQSDARIRQLLAKKPRRLEFRVTKHGQCEGLAWSNGRWFLSNEAGKIKSLEI